MLFALKLLTYFFIFLFHLAIPLKAERKLGEINGKVANFQKQPIPYATVVLVDTNSSTIVSAIHTDRLGEFNFHNLKLKSYFVKVSALGYKSNVWKVTLNKKHSHIALRGVFLKTNVSLLDEVLIVAEQDSSLTTIPQDTSLTPEDSSSDKLSIKKNIM